MNVKQFVSQMKPHVACLFVKVMNGLLNLPLAGKEFNKVGDNNVEGSNGSFLH